MENCLESKKLSKWIMEMMSSAMLAKAAIELAINLIKQGEWKESKKNIDKAEKLLINSDKIRFNMLKKDVSNVKFNYSLLLMHAESQVASTQMMLCFAKEIIYLNQKIRQ